MKDILLTIWLNSIPVTTVAFFIVSLVLFCLAKSKNKKHPGSFSKEQVKLRLILLIVSSAIIATLLFAILVLYLLALSIVAFM